jgi:hypothetical protein
VRRRFLRKMVIHALDNGGRDTGPYLTRWTLLEIAGWSLKLHRFHRSDEDRDLHDHPWTFWSLILLGGYYEWLPYAKTPDEARWNRSRHRHWRRPLSVLHRPAPSPHRVELKRGTEGKVWTLVLTKPKTRQWGFYTVCGWIPWPRYASAKTEGC